MPAPRPTRWSRLSLSLLALAALFSLGDQCGGGGGSPGVFLAVGDANEIVTAESPASVVDVQLGNHRMALSPLGELFITDLTQHVVLRASITGEVTLGAGTYQAGNNGSSGAGAAFQLDQPVGIDVSADGDAFFTDFGNDRILRLDAATGDVTTVGTLPSASGDRGPMEVVVGDGVLYVGEKHRLGTSGSIWKLTPDGTPDGTWEDLLPDETVNSEGMALFGQTLYVAATEGTSFDPTDAYICALDTTDPSAGCDVIQRQAVFGAAEGPPFPEIPLLFGIEASWAVDLAVDGRGVLYVLANLGLPNFELIARGGARPPMIFSWDLPGGATEMTPVFGNPDHYETGWLTVVCGTELILDGTSPTDWYETASAQSVTVGFLGSILVSAKGGLASGFGAGCPSAAPAASIEHATYEIRNVGAGSHVWYGGGM